MSKQIILNWLNNFSLVDMKDLEGASMLDNEFNSGFDYDPKTIRKEIIKIVEAGPIREMGHLLMAGDPFKKEGFLFHIQNDGISMANITMGCGMRHVQFEDKIGLKWSEDQTDASVYLYGYIGKCCDSWMTISNDNYEDADDFSMFRFRLGQFMEAKSGDEFYDESTKDYDESKLMWEFQS